MLFLYSIWMLLTLESFSPLLSPLLAPSSPLRHKRQRFDTNLNPPLLSFQADVDMRSEDEDKDDKMAMLPENLPTSYTYGLNLPCRCPLTCLHRCSIRSTIWRQPFKLSDSGLLNGNRVISQQRPLTRGISTVMLCGEICSMYQAGVVNVDLMQVRIPTFPVMAVKATMFLEYTSTCLKVF
jgi:hypothetical protein